MCVDQRLAGRRHRPDRFEQIARTRHCEARGERGAWGAVLGGWSSHDGTATANAADVDSLGLIGGYDFVAGQNSLFGAALSWTATDMSAPSLANAARIESFALAVYGAATRGALFAEGSAGVSRRDYSFTRGSESTCPSRISAVSRGESTSCFSK